MENKQAELIIKLEEGMRTRPYYCSEQYPTIGYGQRIGDKGEPLPNITTTEKEALKFLRGRISEIIIALSSKQSKAWNNCNPQRQAVLISLAYQLGVTGVLAFKKMWAAIDNKDFNEAAIQMMDSKWAKQTRNRAIRQSSTMRSGSLDQYYLSSGVY